MKFNNCCAVALVLCAAGQCATADVLVRSLTFSFNSGIDGNNLRAGLGYDVPGSLTETRWILTAPIPQPYPATFTQTFLLTGPNTPIPGSDEAFVVSMLTNGTQEYLHMRLTSNGIGGGIGQVEGVHPLGSGWHLGTPDLHAYQLSRIEFRTTNTRQVWWDFYAVPAPATALALFAWPLLSRRRRPAPAISS
jgi:hypothetical protein